MSQAVRHSCFPMACVPTSVAARRMCFVNCWTKASWVMFCLNDTMRYYLCPGRTDMRKGISSLCGVVHERMRSDVKNGDVFIFIGRGRRLMKLLHAEDGGMVMYVKRLEAGRFKLPEYDENTQSYQMEWRDLVMMVEGIQESPEGRLRRLRAERREYVV